MSDMYAIKTSTLTAMGDVIRDKTWGEDIPYSRQEVVLAFDSSYSTLSTPRIKYTVPNCSQLKVRINPIGEYSYSNYNWVISYDTGSGSTLKVNQIDFDTVFPYEFIHTEPTIKFYGSKHQWWSQVSSSRLNTTTFDVELIGLDENGEEVKFKYTPLEMVEEFGGMVEDYETEIDNINQAHETEINELVEYYESLPLIPEEALNLTGSCNYKFSNNGWNWFIEQCGDKITTKDISTPNSMFYYSDSLKEIPFNINTTKTSTNYESAFYYCNKLKSLPYIIGPEKTPPTGAYSGTISLGSIFSNCRNIRNIPNDYFWKMIPNKDFWDKNATLTSQTYSSIFSGCYSLREHPDISMLGGVWTSPYNCIYYYLFNNCRSLDKVENLPVGGTYTSNAFAYTFDNCYRLKELIFAVNEDGTPKIANWKNQNINTKMFGYMVDSNETSWLKYNHGITADKKVSDDASYQLLKDNPDYYTTDERYSLYNHDAAVRTINSLPDCSAYGTNTINFKGIYGEYTDEGAINTLTEEEIAVAVAKGWTVSLS